MFDTHLFGSWLSIFIGACFFALLFTLVGMMSDFVFEGVIRISTQSLGLSALAFWGYLCTAAVIRNKTSNL